MISMVQISIQRRINMRRNNRSKEQNVHINEKWKLERKRRQANQRGNKQTYETEGRIERQEDRELRQRQQAKKKKRRKNELINYLVAKMKILGGVRGR
jgi:hypothetical protein